MATIFIFHGVGGSPQENWFPWLAEKLKEQGHRVIVPQFPHADHPEPKEWLGEFEPSASLLNGDAILIGHSLGGAFALRLLERATQPIRATFLVASVWNRMGNEYDPLMTSFTAEPYDWPKIRKNGGAMHVFHGENDPYIALEKSEQLANNLQADFTIIPEGKHLNATAGFKTFEQLFNEIQSATSSS